MACDQGQTKTRRDEDGIVTLPHTHYARQPISDYHRHSRGKTCEEVRSGISRLLSKHIDFRKRKIRLGSTFMKHKRVSVRKQILVEKKIKDANKKRRAFYKTTKGIAVMKAYKEKAPKKRRITNQLSELKLKSKASLQLETIQNLIKLFRLMIL